MTRRIFFPFHYLSRKVQITHVVIDFFQIQGWFVPCIQLMPYRTINMLPIGSFALFCDLEAKWKSNNSGRSYDNDKAKGHVKKYEQCCFTSCQQDVRLTKMHLPLILYSSLIVRQLKDLLLPLYLQHLAKYCHLMY